MANWIVETRWKQLETAIYLFRIQNDEIKFWMKSAHLEHLLGALDALEIVIDVKAILFRMWKRKQTIRSKIKRDAMKNSAHWLTFKRSLKYFISTASSLFKRDRSYRSDNSGMTQFFKWYNLLTHFMCLIFIENSYTSLEIWKFKKLHRITWITNKLTWT